MTAGVTIRDGRPEEAAQLARLARAAVPGEVVSAGGAVPVSALRREIEADRLFVAECDGRVAGYAAVREAGGALVLDQLVVAATDQGRGVGNALLDWVEGYGVSRRLEAVRVPSDGVDARARDFYLRRGYADGEAGLERALAHA